MVCLVSVESLRRLLSDLNGPRFFASWHSLEREGEGITDVAYLRVGTRDLLLVLTSANLHIYELLQSTSLLLQTLTLSLSTPLATMEAFSVSGRDCVAVAGGRGQIFCWSASSQSFLKTQDLYTSGAVSVEYFQQTGTSFRFLIFSCNGTTAAGGGMPSYVYVWSSDRFFLFQYLPTSGAVRSSSVSTSAGSFIAVTTQAGQAGQFGSTVFRWNGTHFDHFVTFDSDAAHLFAAGELIFMVSSNALHRFDPVSSSFVTHAPISDDSLRHAVLQYFSINTEHYLVVGKGSSTSNGTAAATPVPPDASPVSVYRLDGAELVLHQALEARDVRTLRGFKVGAEGRSVLAELSEGGVVSLYRWTAPSDT